MKKLIYTLLSLLLFASCDRDDGAYSELGNGELRITSTIATRASGTSWAADDKIGVSVYKTTTTTAYGEVNTPYKTATTSGNFVATDDPLYYPAAEYVDLLAYYPYVDLVDLTAYELSVGGRQTESQIDLMKATATELKSSSSAVNLTFYHKLSKLQITMTDGEAALASELVGGTMTLSGAVTEGEYNLHTDKITLDTATDDIVATIDSDGVAEMILIPQTLSGALLTFNTSQGAIYTVTLSATFASGDQTSYTAKMSLVEATLSGATISPWGADSDTSDDDLIAGVDSGLSHNSETGDYEIYTAAGFASINDLIAEKGGNINITLTNDIDLSSVCGEGGNNWTPISGFKGSFDGAGHSISGLYIDAEDSSYQGLFGTLEWISGAISNVTIVEPIVKGSNEVGALVGNIFGDGENGTTIENCAVVGGEISGSWATGSLIGTCWENVNLINCYNTATVNGEDVAGGLIGMCEMFRGSIIACYNTGDVSGTWGVGGLAGMGMMMNNVNIVDCYNTGNIDGTDNLGGLFGSGDMMDYVYFTACYNTGDVRGTAELVGGLVGSGMVNYSYITACYNTGDVEGTNYIGGLFGRVDMWNSSMTACYNSGSVTAIDSDIETVYIGGVSSYFYGSEYTFSACYFIDNGINGIGYEEGSNETAAEDATTSFTNIAALNDVVETLNAAITTYDSTIAYEYQAGADDNVLPTVVAKSVTE